MSPTASTLSVRPTTNWLAANRCERLACTNATARPASSPNASATSTLPETSEPRAAPNAPVSIIASTEMFSVPAFSATHSPTAAKPRSPVSRAVLA